MNISQYYQYWQRWSVILEIACYFRSAAIAAAFTANLAIVTLVGYLYWHEMSWPELQEAFIWTYLIAGGGSLAIALGYLLNTFWNPVTRAAFQARATRRSRGLKSPAAIVFPKAHIAWVMGDALVFLVPFLQHVALAEYLIRRHGELKAVHA